MLNLNLLSSEIQAFISSNTKTDLNKLILKGSPFSTVSIQEIAQQIEGKNKCEKKLPTWFETENIIYPKKLNLEQTSSEETANYKAALVSGNSLIDLTGGFGVDCFAFSKKINSVIHCEMNAELSAIVTHNYQQLGVRNIKTIEGDSVDYLKNTKQNFDWIYIDPSRRNDAKEKVFLLKDCLPNVPENMDELFSHSNKILIKTAPLLDISSAISELKFVKEIHIIALLNEVKELLFVLEKNSKSNIQIKTINLLKTEKQVFNFDLGIAKTADFQQPLNYLYEPNAAILKSGGFHQIAIQFGLYKLHQNTHLYTSEEFIANFPGRKFKINSQTNYDKKQLLSLIPDKKANITTRNFPETVAQIRKKTKIKDGGTNYLFFTTNFKNEKMVLFCSKTD